MIIVYFETTQPAAAEIVAIFDDEETYNVCFPSLEILAKKHHWDIITESVDDNDIDDLLKERV